MTDPETALDAQATTPRKAGNSRFVARMIESHSILGLAFAALIYIVSLTGAFTVFAHEIELWENAWAPTVASVSGEVYQNALEEAYAARDPDGDLDSLVAYGPSEFAPALLVRLNETDEQGNFQQTNWIADPQTGTLLGKAEAPLAHLIEELHVALHLPTPWGRYLVGLLGVCMFSLVISGILAHPTIFKDAFKLRVDRNKRTAWTDVHNRLSVWGLPFHLVLTFTGGFLGLAGLIVGAVAMIAYEGDQERALASIQGPMPVEGRALEEFPPIASMVETARTDGRPVELLVMQKPANAGGVTTVNVLDKRLLDQTQSLIFRNSGAFIESYGGAGAPGGIRALAMLQPLHYGTFGGYPVKLLYFVMALALTWVTSSGMKIWFARRQQQGRPVPRLNAAWQGMTAGLTLGLSAATLVAASGLGELALAACLGGWAAAFALLLSLPARASVLYPRLLLGSGAGLVVAAGLWLAEHGVKGIVPNAVDGSVLALGIVLAVAGIRGRGE
ncbi:PepSY-associated TM helix domain-containing protein [Citromicrobium bathyomarinum]|uniref:PepSY-associated TM helix domain-containing protein n=1 Tax=Citromicrobium bathyomarinum TaxID=72174 RepID=UPI00315AD92B